MASGQLAVFVTHYGINCVWQSFVGLRDAVVHVFCVMQGAHGRIRAMANQTQQQNFNGPQQQRGPARRSLPPPEVQQ